jgi:predicted regulator of Ras-like GTPase activity (Roadblock/LC7/MglB family)
MSPTPGGATPVANPRVGGRDFRRLLDELLAPGDLLGGLIVAPDGLVIAARVPADVSVEALSALAASLGRELELDGARSGRGGFVMAHFRSDQGWIFLGGTPVGYIVLLAPGNVDRDRVRQTLRSAVDTVRRAWVR